MSKSEKKFVPEKVKKVLFIKLCCVGDLLFTTPALRAFKKKLKLAEFVYLTSSWSKEVVKRNPHVDRVIVFDTPYLKINKINKYFQTLKMGLKLRQEGFDLVVVFHRSVWVNLFASLIGAPHRVGFDDCGSGFPLTRKVAFDPREHEVKRYLSLAESLQIKSKEYKLEMAAPDGEEKQRVEKLLAEHNIKDDSLIIGVAPGGGNNPGTSMPIKRWPANRYAKIIDDLISKFRARVFLLGDLGDVQVGEEIMNLTKSKPINLVGKTTWLELAALLPKCRLFIGNDSGPLYMASAFGVKTIGIYGPSDPDLVAPLSEKHLSLRKKVTCSPCYRPDTLIKEKIFECKTKTHECMKSIAPEEVLKAAEKLLSIESPEIKSKL